MATAEPPIGAVPPEPASEAVTEPAAAAASAPDSVKPALRVGVLAVMLVVAILIYTMAPAGIVESAVPLFLLAIIAQMAPVFISRRFDPFSAANYTAIVGGVTLISMLAQLYASGEIPFVAMPRLSYDERVELLQKISLAYIVQGIGYALGYYFSNGFGSIGRRLPTFPSFEWNSQRFWMICAGCWALFALGFARFQSLASGSWFSAATAESKAVWRNEDDRMAWLFRALQLGMVPLYAIVTRFITKSTHPRIRRQWMVLLLALIAGMAVLAARIGQRGYLLFMIIGVAGIAHYTWRRIPTPVILLSGLIAIAAANWLGQVRTNDETAGSFRVTSALARPAEVLARFEDDRDHLAATGCAMYFFPERQEYLKGKSFLNIVLAPIPRAIWPDKNQYIGWSENGIVWLLIELPAPMPFPFVLYANFGWIGMFIGMALWGAFHRTLFQWVHRNEYRPQVVALYATVLVTFSPTASGIASFLGAGLPIFLMMKVMRRR